MSTKNKNRFAYFIFNLSLLVNPHAQSENFTQESPRVEINYRTICGNDQWVKTAKQEAIQGALQNAQLHCRSRVNLISNFEFKMECHSILDKPFVPGSWLQASGVFECRSPGPQVTGKGRITEKFLTTNTKRRFAQAAAWEDARKKCQSARVYLVSKFIFTEEGSADEGSPVSVNAQFECDN